MKLFRSLLLLSAAFAFSSCVHEFPENRETVDVVLTVHHDLPWTFYTYEYDSRSRRMSVSRGDDNRAADREVKWSARYVFRAYPEGVHGDVYKQFEFVSDDLELKDFTYTLQLPPGEWEICAWQDFVSDEVQPPFYDIKKFDAITYNEPYRGDTDRREAFEGFANVSVRSTYESAVTEYASMTMERPMARYIFIATDYADFSADASSKGEDEDDYSVLALYPMFMPSVYNMFTSKIIDSWRAVSYTGQIRPISDTEAIIAIDYVFMNHHESGAQVQLGLTSPNGRTTALTPTLTVPLQRGQTTYVRGKFLTTKVGGGVEVDFSFDNDINIKI